MAYSPQQIRDYITQQGYAGPGGVTNPIGIYNAAQQYGVNADQIDQAMGFQPGASNAYIQQNGLRPLEPYQQGLARFGTNAITTPFGTMGQAGQQVAQQVAPAQTSTAVNPYIGQTTSGVTGTNPYLGQNAQQAAQSQFAGQSSGQVSYTNADQQRATAAGNYMMGLNNPYLTNAINAASGDAIRNYNLAVAPQRQAQMESSGSFGNTGVQQMQLEDQRNLQNTLGDIATGARMQDYAMQAQLAEADAARRTGTSQFNAAQGNQLGLANAQNQLGAQQFNVNARAGDLARNLGADNQLSMFNASLGQNDLNRNLGAFNQLGMFNANLAQNDLTRNTNAALGLGTFNAGQLNNMGQFNAGQAQQTNLFNAGQGNAINQFNTGQANNIGLENARLGQQQGQFNDTLDFDIFNQNAQNSLAANQQVMNAYLQMLGLQNQGLQMANNIYMTPYNQLAGFNNMAQLLGGMGSSASQTMPGNPLLGAIGGFNLGSALGK